MVRDIELGVSEVGAVATAAVIVAGAPMHTVSTIEKITMMQFHIG